jgi:farnesyl-diphosphate farnesyltransferase
VIEIHRGGGFGNGRPGLHSAMSPLELAARTARSFALSLRLLPRVVREEVTLAYLLARASDTLADAPGLAADQRLAALERFADAVAGDGGTLDTPACAGCTAGERELLAALPALLETLAAQDAGALARVRRVLALIISGQRLDIQRFEQNHLGRLAEEAQLLDYTWRVAGCVGEYWTEVLAARLPACLGAPAAEMSALGRRYGQGLQLLNILRDAPADLQKGRCYLPPGPGSGGPAAGLPGWPQLHAGAQAWLPPCRAGLEAGLVYASQLNGARVRAASGLPARLGLATLKLLETAGMEAWRAGIKVPRRAVYRHLLACLAGFGNARR